MKAQKFQLLTEQEYLDEQKMKKIEQEIMAEEPNLLYLILSGSRLYGTNMPESDFDYRGIFANSETEVMGLDRRDSQTYKSEDITLHGLHKFIKLAIDANPNILELFFADEATIYVHPLFKKYFIDNRDLFLTQKCYHTYSGYAISQVQRSKHKSGHGILREKYIVGPESDPYDSKYAMHTARLMMNAEEILRHGTLHPKFEGEDLEFLRSIRAGETFENATMFYRYVKQTDERLKMFHEFAKVNKTLPHHADRKRIERLVVDFYKEYYKL